MIGPAIFSKLSSLELPSNLTNEDGTVRVYSNYVRMYDKCYPQIVYALSNYQADQSLDGNPLSATVDAAIIAVGRTYDDADALGTAIATAIDQTKGTWGTVAVQGCFVEEIDEDHFVDTDMETILYYTKEIRCKIIYLL